MSDDLVKRLSAFPMDANGAFLLVYEAADEIERLRAELLSKRLRYEDLRSENEELRTRVDDLLSGVREANARWVEARAENEALKRGDDALREDCRAAGSALAAVEIENEAMNAYVTRKDRQIEALEVENEALLKAMREALPFCMVPAMETLKAAIDAAMKDKP